jgi:hypothetical protein
MELKMKKRTKKVVPVLEQVLVVGNKIFRKGDKITINGDVYKIEYFNENPYQWIHLVDTNDSRMEINIDNFEFEVEDED